MQTTTDERVSFAAIWVTATTAAAAAAKLENDRLPPENARGFDCGFAWVYVKPARGPFVSWCKKNGHGRTRNYGGGGYEFWYSEFDPTTTQSISVHQAAARAFADVLRKHGIAAQVDSRLD